MPTFLLTSRRKAGMDKGSWRLRSQALVKVFIAVSLMAIFMCIGTLKHNNSIASTAEIFSRRDGLMHIVVTGGAGYIGSHAALRLLEDGYRVTIVDNLSRGNLGAIKVLEKHFPEPGKLQFICADLGDTKAVDDIFSRNAIDAVMHFAAVAYVGESVSDPLRYYHNITFDTLILLEAMERHNVKKMIYSSTCATYGEPKVMPITEDTPQAPINPYGKAKKMAEDIIIDYTRRRDFAVAILRYFNVIGSDPKVRIGEAPRPDLRIHGHISAACFDAVTRVIPALQVRGKDYETKDGTCVRDYVHVTDLVDAHVRALQTIVPSKVSIYNIGTGQGISVMEFINACMDATGVKIDIEYVARRPGDYAEVWCDPSKVKRELNWSAQYVNLKETLEVAWRWRQAHPHGYPLIM